MVTVLLIVFREALEAALLVGVVFAATRGIPGRGRWIGFGMAGGAIGALLVAAGAEQLTAALEGIGQEIFNAGVLGLAVAMLSWHTLWMKAHARDMINATRALGESISIGQQPLYALAILVGLAVLREGSEIVLFLTGLSAAGSVTRGGLLAGGVLGLLAGVGVGGGVACGLLRMSVKHLFGITSAWIALLAASMAAQALAFLTQAGLIAVLTETAWDTTGFVADQSIPGQVLRALFGYIGAPMKIQVLAYVSVVVGLGLALWRPPLLRQRALSILVGTLAVLAGMMPIRPARADFQVYSPYVEQGAWEFEFRGTHSFDKRAAQNAAQGYLTEIGYSPTSFWHTALFFEAEGVAANHLRASEFAWENLFQLTEPGQYWLDLGAYIEYAKGLFHANNNALEWKILAEKAVGNWTFTVNPIFSQEFGRGSAPGVQFGYAGGTHYRLSPFFEPGFEAYGSLGELAHALPGDLQQHCLGPDLRGQVRIGRGKLEYNVGYLFGLTPNTPQGAVKLTLEYEVRF